MQNTFRNAVSPASAGLKPVMPHKFTVGQSVEYYDALTGGAGLFTILRLLREDAGEFQYHIQRAAGAEQRRVRESQLRLGEPVRPPIGA